MTHTDVIAAHVELVKEVPGMSTFWSKCPVRSPRAEKLFFDNIILYVRTLKDAVKGADLDQTK